MRIVPIPGCPGYGASKDGFIWSKRVSGRWDHRAKEWRKLKTQIYKKTNYRYLTLGLPQGQTSFLVHRLIALTFLGPRPEGYEINHKDTHKWNNAANNLEYLLPIDNLRHAWDNNLIVIGKPKLTQEQVDEIRRLHGNGIKQKYLALQFNVNSSAISDIVNYVTWKARVVKFAALAV